MIILISIILICIFYPIILFCDNVGARTSEEGALGYQREMSVWFDFTAGFFVTFAGFFLAMQFEDIFDKRADAEKEDDIWTIINHSLKEIKDKVFNDERITTLIVLCDALLKTCEIDSIAISTTRKSPFYKRLYYILTELHTLPLEKNDLLFLGFSNLQIKEKEKGTDKELIIEAVWVWLIILIFLDSIDFSKHKLFMDEEWFRLNDDNCFEDVGIIPRMIENDMRLFFCFNNEYVDIEKKTKSKGYEILKKIRADMFQISKVEQYLNDEAKKFCEFLKTDDGESLGSKKEIIKKIKIGKIKSVTPTASPC